MPCSRSNLSPGQQLQAHEAQLMQLRYDIEEHLQNPPPKGAKANILSSYREKQEFLKFEIMRYETYILTLRTKSTHDS